MGAAATLEENLVFYFTLGSKYVRINTIIISVYKISNFSKDHKQSTCICIIYNQLISLLELDCEILSKQSGKAINVSFNCKSLILKP